MITLTGMMGSGKSTVGRLLAQNLGLEFIDLDIEIVNREQLEINEIFSQKGESYFRKREKELIKALAGDNIVLALGGGSFEDSETREFLNQNSDVIYLESDSKEIFERIKLDTTRPLLKNNMSVDKIEEILQKRVRNYKRAKFTINTCGKSVDTIASEIIGVLYE